MAGAEFELAVDTSVDVVAAGEEPFAEIALVVEGAHGAGTAIYRAGRRVVGRRDARLVATGGSSDRPESPRRVRRL